MSSTPSTRQASRWRGGTLAAATLSAAALLATASGPVRASSSDSTPGSASSGSAGDVTFPMSFEQATAAGAKVDFGARCDSDKGTVKMPWFFAQPCYAPFHGDNGGSTAPGVTAGEITVAWYLPMAGDPVMGYITDAVRDNETSEQKVETMGNLVSMFETYYETYGRAVKIVPVEGTGTALDETAARADAVHIAEDIKPFMVWGGPALTDAFADELAAHQIPCLGCTPGQTQQWYAEHDPYVWSLDVSAEQALVEVQEMITKQLIGKPVSHADALNGTPRVFGLIAVESSSSATALSDRLAETMDAAGAPLAERFSYQLDPNTIQQNAAQGIAKMKAAGVTTVVFRGDPIAPREFTKEATAQGYFPEWVLVGGGLMDVTAFARTYDQAQWKHAFGWTSVAARKTQKQQDYFRLYQWWTGQEPPAPKQTPLIGPYPAVFYAILQGIGPNLTVDSWRTRITSAKPTRRALTAPSLSWGDQGIWPAMDYNGVDDGTLIWWDPEATGLDEVGNESNDLLHGMYQWVDGGKRYLPGEFPSDDQYFVRDGAVALYDAAPTDEGYADYPPLK